MRMKSIINAAAAVFVILLLAGCRGKTGEESGIVILASTTMGAALAQDLMPDARVTVLIPPDSCPGHFDLKPSDAASIMRADLFLVHSFQEGLIEKMRGVRPDAAPGVITTTGTTIPENYIKALEEAQVILAGVFERYSEEIKKNLEQRRKKINTLEKESAPRLERIREGKFKAFVSEMHKELAFYLGIESAGYFGDPKSISPARLETMIREGMEKEIDFIVSNTAGTHDTTADILVSRTGLKKVMAANFPGSAGAGFGFEGLWEYNLSAVEERLK